MNQFCSITTLLSLLFSTLASADGGNGGDPGLDGGAGRSGQNGGVITNLLAPDAPGEEKYTFTIMNCDRQSTDALMHDGFSINAKIGGEKNTALQRAILYNCTEIIQDMFANSDQNNMPDLRIKFRAGNQDINMYQLILLSGEAKEMLLGQRTALDLSAVAVGPEDIVTLKILLNREQGSKALISDTRELFFAMTNEKNKYSKLSTNQEASGLILSRILELQKAGR